MSQAEAAAELGIETNTYSTYERRTPMPHHLIPKACQVFGVKADYFYSLDLRSAEIEERPPPKRSTG